MLHMGFDRVHRDEELPGDVRVRHCSSAGSAARPPPARSAAGAAASPDPRASPFPSRARQQVGREPAVRRRSAAGRPRAAPAASGPASSGEPADALALAERRARGLVAAARLLRADPERPVRDRREHGALDRSRPRSRPRPSAPSSASASVRLAADRAGAAPAPSSTRGSRQARGRVPARGSRPPRTRSPAAAGEARDTGPAHAARSAGAVLRPVLRVAPRRPSAAGSRPRSLSARRGPGTWHAVDDRRQERRA